LCVHPTTLTWTPTPSATSNTTAIQHPLVTMDPTNFEMPATVGTMAHYNLQFTECKPHSSAPTLLVSKNWDQMPSECSSPIQNPDPTGNSCLLSAESSVDVISPKLQLKKYTPSWSFYSARVR